MLPQKHFLIAALVIVPAAFVFFPDLTFVGVGLWVLCGGLLSAAIDFDVMALVFLKSKEEDRLKLFRNPFEINRNFSHFMDTIYDTGVLKVAMTTHLALAAVFISIVYFTSISYFIPAALGGVSHLVSDIPNYKRVF